MESPPHPARPATGSRNALVLTGGGARAAYQVGVLRSLARPLEVLAELGRVEGVSEQLQQAKAREAQT